ncbi:carbohydrate ABC transporter permease [Streptomyces sp. NBC_00335]|uniref:carbohydrate ABC transporter permease n=1 Tax=unclassified Streptomyces TaxID=2593676 RepID=UPI0022597ACF|nr:MULTISPECIES: carbohydrate ABC transporter permease [unclassified Streptomyces]MCX5402676.1 carbohydrate ABC transporter permease [Streptomyces sp. NBC_00086]
MSTQTAPSAPPEDAPAGAPAPAAGAPTARQAERKPAGKRRRSGAMASKAVVNAVLLVAVLYTLMPLTWLLIAATKSHADLFGTAGFAFGEFRFFDNLRAVFGYGDGIFGRWLLNSLLYSVVGSLASSLISLAAGYCFDKYEFRGKGALFGLVLTGTLVPTIVITLPQYLLASEVGIVNTYWSVLIPALVNPFGVYLARVFSEGYVPGEVLEAARIDGASELRVFRSISLPMLLPGFMTLFLFSFTASWNNFFGPLVMLNDQHLYPAVLGIYSWNQMVLQYPEFYSLVITGSLVAVVPLALAFVGLQRFWRSGLSAGAVK